jgi:hypothetical protein
LDFIAQDRLRQGSMVQRCIVLPGGRTHPTKSRSLFLLAEPAAIALVCASLSGLSALFLAKTE